MTSEGTIAECVAYETAKAQSAQAAQAKSAAHQQRMLVSRQKAVAVVCAFSHDSTKARPNLTQCRQFVRYLAAARSDLVTATTTQMLHETASVLELRPICVNIARVYEQ